MENKLSSADFINSFFEFEQKNNLFGIKIKGCKFWDYIRWPVIEYIVSDKYKPKLSFQYHRLSARRTKSLKEILAGSLYFIPYATKLIFNYFALRNNMFDLVIFDHSNRKIIDNMRVNQITYPFIKHFDNSFSILVFDPSQPKDNVDGKYPCRVINTRIFYILAKMFVRFIRLSDEDKVKIEKLRRLILSNYGINCDINQTIKDIYLPQLILTKAFKVMLRKIKPKLVIIVYDGKKYFIQAPHDLGIPVLELQHGAITLLDPYYSYPDLSLQEIDTIPDYFFTFGKYWNNKVNSPSCRIDVGSPYFEQISKDIKGRRIKRNSKNILAVSALDYNMAESISEFAELMPDYEVYYKLRPEEYVGWKELYPKKMTEQKNITFIDNDKKSIFEYLCEANYVISTFSTAIHEALFFGANVIIFKGWQSEMFQDLADDGYALQAASAKQIKEIVIMNKKSEKSIESEYLYKSDSLKNMEEQLKRRML